MKLSIIVPCKNKEGNVKGLYKKITSELNDIKYELIFIDDGSKDQTYKMITELSMEKENITGLHVLYIFLHYTQE